MKTFTKIFQNFSNFYFEIFYFEIFYFEIFYFEFCFEIFHENAQRSGAFGELR
jgi:hypothetical protein